MLMCESFCFERGLARTELWAKRLLSWTRWPYYTLPIPVLTEGGGRADIVLLDSPGRATSNKMLRRWVPCDQVHAPIESSWACSSARYQQDWRKTQVRLDIPSPRRIWGDRGAASLGYGRAVRSRDRKPASGRSRNILAEQAESDLVSEIDASAIPTEPGTVDSAISAKAR
jgi:hypothetical protein